MKLSQYHSVYFLGIGGIGMSALARWFMKSGVLVAGYDKTSTVLTDALASEGMEIHFHDDPGLIPEPVRNDSAHSLIIYTPAIPKDHKEHQYLKEKGYTILKRSEVLGLITKQYKTIAVAGTHGKTTTSSMVAHILKSAGRDMVAFLGGITTNYGSNLIMNGQINEGTLAVVEADEFDRSFLRLFPHIAIVTSADADHLDIYGDAESVTQGFKDFVKKVDSNGHLIIHNSIVHKLTEGMDSMHISTYSINQGQFFASNIASVGGFFEFDLHGFGPVVPIRLGVPGFHNVENAIAAVVATTQVGVGMVDVQKALASFTGVKRRFEFILRTKNIVFVDDYAHHPTEIEAFLTSLKAMFKEKKLTIVFQPHLYTRTRDFAEGFSKSLSIADEVLLMDIYPARELPIPGVNEDLIFRNITSPVKIRCDKNDVLQKIEDLSPEVVATIGAGDIDTCVGPIKKLLEARYV